MGRHRSRNGRFGVLVDDLRPIIRKRECAKFDAEMIEKNGKTGGVHYIHGPKGDLQFMCWHTRAWIPSGGPYGQEVEATIVSDATDV